MHKSLTFEAKHKSLSFSNLQHFRYNIKYITIKSSAGEATVSDYDIEATNGVVHIVDHVF